MIFSLNDYFLSLHMQKHTTHAHTQLPHIAHTNGHAHEQTYKRTRTQSPFLKPRHLFISLSADSISFRVIFVDHTHTHTHTRLQRL